MYLFNEMAKLIAMLVNANVEFELNPFARHAIKDGKVTNEHEAWIEILYPNARNPKISVSMTNTTMGGKDGLLEIVKYKDNGDFEEWDEGWLTAEKAFEYFKKEEKPERIPRSEMRETVDKFYNELISKTLTEEEEDFMFFYNEMLHYGEYESETDVDFLKHTYESWYEINNK